MLFRQRASPISAGHSEFLPNDVFGVSAMVHKGAFQLEKCGMKTTIELQKLKPAGREAITAMLVALPKRHATQGNRRKHS